MSTIFRAFMGAVAALMLLPGLYLYAVDGCRPEDYKEEEQHATWKSGEVLVLALLSLGSSFGIYASMVFRVSMGVVASMMLLPGVYLYVVEGCRPEDFTDEVGGRRHTGGSIVLVLTGLSLISFYGGACMSTIFRAFMGAVAALMLLPGLYLYVVDGCRPEDCKEEEQNTAWKSGEVLVLALLGLGFCFGIYASSFFRISMAVVASMMLLPGVYLYVVEGCRPGDFTDEVNVRQHRGISIVLVLTGLSLIFVYGGACMCGAAFMVAVAALMLLPGLYLYVVDGCRPEDYKEEEQNATWKSGGALVLALLGLGSFYGMYTSMIFRTSMGVVASMMLLPGVYLYVVEGCRPEDFTDEVGGRRHTGGSIVLVLTGLSLISFYGGACVSTIFRVCMGAVAALMLLPGLYLYVVDGCRPEDYKEDD